MLIGLACRCRSWWDLSLSLCLFLQRSNKAKQVYCPFRRSSPMEAASIEGSIHPVEIAALIVKVAIC